MPELKFTLNVTMDGNPLPDMPLVYRFVTPQAVNQNLVAVADNNTTTFHGITAIGENPLQIFMMTMDQAMNLNLNQLTALPMSAGGLILVLGCNLTQATPANNVTFNNPAATTSANLTILAGGT